MNEGFGERSFPRKDKRCGRLAALAAPVLVLALASCGGEPSRGAAAVDTARLIAANDQPGAWMSHGRTYDEQRFSPLTQITAENVNTLGLAWWQDLDTMRGQEATPIIVDGVIYISTAWSMVKAYDAKTGEALWAYDPKVPGEWAVKACCDVVNRGVAVWKGKVFVGTLDGRLIALNSKTGKQVWSVNTIERDKDYTITGAPRVIKGKVIIGNGGAEFGVRGYVSAYDAETGKMDWRFYTVPGNPADGFERPVLEVAAKTWTGEWWKLGGGGTVWDSMAYDPQLDLLYIGVGNGSPWNQAVRSPKGGDNLFLSSIVALDPDNGDYVWHYQETPGETWDYTATQHIIVADLSINGENRRVLMHAPKNGFFYVIDARTGKLLSARNFVPINWAAGVDMKTGRPVENPRARYDQTGEPFLVVPGPGGAHNWQPMSFSPQTGLVYIPAQESGFPYVPDKDFKPAELGFNVGVDMAAASMPQDPKVKNALLAGVKGALLAWDPVAQREVWRVDYDGVGHGGVLSTAGGLVFQGNKSGQFAAFDAATGKKLWSTEVQTGVLAPPASYEIEGEQYVTVLVGTGGVWALAPGEAGSKGGMLPNRSRLLVYKLGGAKALPALPPQTEPQLAPPAATADAAIVAGGARLYARFCGTCHGDAAHSAGMLPDLRYSGALDPSSDLWDEVVFAGALKDRGMVSFKKVLTKQESEAIRAYLIARANQDLAAEKAAPPK